MKNHVLSSIGLTFWFVILFCVVFTLALTGIAQFAPNKGNGEIINYNNQKFYSNIGQKFTDDSYFWSRPSAVDYNAAGSCGSNKGPSNPDYLAAVQGRIDSFLSHNPGIQKSHIPSDLVTASSSGLDPHISLQAARIQVKRIATIRNIEEYKIAQLVDEHIESPLFGFLGPQRINVLKLNIALNNLK